MKKCEKFLKICKMYELDVDFILGMDYFFVFYEMEDNCDMGFKESFGCNKFYGKK